MSYIKELTNVPELDFLGGVTLEDIREDILKDYSAQYERITGTLPNLRESNPYRMQINSFSLKLYQTLLLIDHIGKQNFLRYATGASLDNLAVLKQLTREPATPAKTMLKFSMEDARSEAVGIPGGTRACTESEVVFCTDEYAEIPAGSTQITVSASAEEPGTASNGFAAGAVSEMMDLVPYISSVTNTAETKGGKDIQSDEDLTLDIFNAPKGTSMGGPEDAYEAKALKMRADIYEVKPVSPMPCYVDIYFTLEDGKLPEAEDLQQMEKYFSPKSMRPQGDRVSAKVPEEVGYSISLTYYIAEENASAEQEIKDKVAAAISTYKVWQRRIGRDINPSELIGLIRDAGAKRVELAAPIFAKIYADAENGVQIGKLTTETVTYGGLEE